MSRWAPQISDGLSFLGFVVLALVLWHIGSDWLGTHNAEAQCKQRLQTIQAALERYSAAHQGYPDHLQALVDAGLLTSLPRNPYWKPATALTIPEQMEERAPAELYPGALGYLRGNDMSRGSYLLLVYGDDKARRAGRTLTGKEVALSPSLAGQARQIAWDHVLYLLDPEGALQGGAPGSSQQQVSVAREDNEQGITPVAVSFAMPNSTGG